MIDAREIERVYRELGHVVLRRARVLLRSDAEARDVLHDVFEDLLARPEQLDGVERRTAWLYRVTTNRCLKRIRERDGRARILRSIGADEETRRGAEAAERRATSAAAEEVARARELLGRLPSPLAEVAVYYHIDGMTHEEIARIIGCSRRHVGDLLVVLQRWSNDHVVARAQ